MKATVAAVVLALALVGAVPAVVFGVAPTITGFTPPSGPIGSLVTITGTNLSGATAVKVNGTIGQIRSNTAVEIKAIVPAGASTGLISVTTSGGTANSSTNFVVTFGIVTSTATAQPGATLKVHGSGFTPSRAVEIYLDGKLRRLVGASATGTFVNVNLKIPKKTETGEHWVSAVDRATSRIAQRLLTVGTNWPQFRGGPLHRGRNSLENIISPANVGNLEEAWSSVATAGEIFSSPAVVNGVVYIGSYDNKLHAYAAAGCAIPPCAPLWSSTATAGDIYSSPAVEDGVVYVGSDDDKLYAFRATGCGAAICPPLWSAATGGDIRSSPVVAKGVVYVGSSDGKLYAFSAAGCGGATTCLPVWSSTSTGGITTSSPAVANGVVYIGSADGKLYAFSANGCGGPAACDPVWSSTAAVYALNSSPAVANGVVYIGSQDNHLYAFLAGGCGATVTGCEPLWSSTYLGRAVNSSPAVANGVVYVGTTYGNMHVFAAGGCGAVECAPLWSSDVIGNFIESSPAVANGVVYVGSSDRLYAFPAGGCGAAICAALWSAATGGLIISSPAVANGVVYVGSGDGRLHAFDLSSDGGVSSAGR